MKNKDKIKMKAGVLLIVWIMIGISVSSVMSGTRIITDESDTVYTDIINSNGKYNSTADGEVGLQWLIDDLDNESGYVELSVCNITLTTTLELGDGCWLRGQGNASVLWLDDNANCTMITNYNAGGTYSSTTINKDIRISDIRLEGNGLNQPEWWSSTNQVNLYAHGIRLHNVRDSIINNVIVNNTASGGIIIEGHGTGSTNVEVTDCYLKDIGKLYEDSGSDETHWYAIGIWLFNATRSTVSNCVVINPYANGIDAEGEYAADEEWANPNIIIDGCIVSDCSMGYYMESARDVVIDGCIAINCTDTTIYGSAAGVFMAADVRDVIVSDLITDSCGLAVNVNGHNVTFSSCKSHDSVSGGFLTYGNNITFIGCSSTSDGGYGFYIQGSYVITDGCYIYDSGSNAIEYTTGEKGIVSDCIIRANANDGISVSSSYITITGNQIYDSASDGIVVSGSNCIISNNYIHDPTTRSILVTGDNTTIQGNNIYRGGQYDASIKISNAVNCSVIGNLICSDPASVEYPYVGINESGTSDYNLIIFNKIAGDIYDAIQTVGANTKVNCTGLDDWNFYDGVS